MNVSIIVHILYRLEFIDLNTEHYFLLLQLTVWVELLVTDKIIMLDLLCQYCSILSHWSGDNHALNQKWKLHEPLIIHTVAEAQSQHFCATFWARFRP